MLEELYLPGFNLLAENYYKNVEDKIATSSISTLIFDYN